jgi:hypothetical protein
MAKPEKAIFPLAQRNGSKLARLPREARRQSLLVSRRRSEKGALEFLAEVADTRGWLIPTG